MIDTVQNAVKLIGLMFYLDQMQCHIFIGVTVVSTLSA